MYVFLLIAGFNQKITFPSGESTWRNFSHRSIWENIENGTPNNGGQFRKIPSQNGRY